MTGWKRAAEPPFQKRGTKDNVILQMRNKNQKSDHGRSDGGD